jgi:hypothetical protein
MKKLLLTLSLMIVAITAKSQSINIPTDYELGYYFGFQGHQLAAAAEFEMGVGLEGFAQTDLFHPGSATDKFYLAPRYRWRGVDFPKWEGTISAGAWTTGLFYNFPIYPLTMGARATLRYEIADNLYVSPQVFLTPSPNESDFSIGLVYTLY